MNDPEMKHLLWKKLTQIVASIVGAVVVDQLAERSLRYQRSAVRIQSPVNFYRTLIYCQLYSIEKKKIKEKESGNGPFFKKHSSELFTLK